MRCTISIVWKFGDTTTEIFYNSLTKPLQLVASSRLHSISEFDKIKERLSLKPSTMAPPINHQNSTEIGYNNEFVFSDYYGANWVDSE